MLCFYCLPAFWRWYEPFESRRKRRSWTVGLICLAIILACLILPLYAMVDVRMSNLIGFCLERVLIRLPFWLICMVLGVIPAMINYSVMRGLLEDIVRKNPERDCQSQGAEADKTKDGYLLRENVFRVILWGMTAVNGVLVCLQINYLFQLQTTVQEAKAESVMQGTLPLLIAIAMSIVFAAISVYMVSVEKRAKIRMVSLIYILTLTALVFILVWRYVLKIVHYGIEDRNLFGLFAIVVLMILLGICLHSISEKNTQVWRKMILWGTILFVLISVIPVEYIVAEVNVQVFISQYDKGLIDGHVSEEELDLEYLGGLGYDAVPSLTRLLSIDTLYEDTGKSVPQAALDELLYIYDQDLSDAERERITEKDVEDGVRLLVDILKEKTKYQVIGKRKISLRALADFSAMQ